MENIEPEEPLIIGWRWYFCEIELFVTEFVARREGANADYCLYAVERCGLIIRTLSDIESAISSETTDASDHSLFTTLIVVRELLQTVRDICREWDELFDTIEGSSNTHAYHASSSQDGSVGRPQFQISREQLVYLHATDPINTAMRWRGQSISRRPYSVPGPNSLWHIGEMTYMSVAYYIPASARLLCFVENCMCSIYGHSIVVEK